MAINVGLQKSQKLECDKAKDLGDWVTYVDYTKKKRATMAVMEARGRSK